MCFNYFAAGPDRQGGRARQFVASPPTFRQAVRREAARCAWPPRSASASTTVRANC